MDMLDPMGMSTHSGETKGVKRESVPIDYVPPASEIGPAKTTMSLIGNTTEMHMMKLHQMQQHLKMRLRAVILLQVKFITYIIPIQ